MFVGYLNIPLDQVAGGLSEQQNALLDEGVSKLFVDIDIGSGSAPQLELALAALQPGDGMVSLSVHTLARTIDGLLSVNAKLVERQASLRVLQMPGGMKLDTASAEGRAILGALALMSGMSMGVSVPVAPPQPTFVPQPIRSRGRPATAGSRADEVTHLHSQGVRAVDIAATLGIGRASVYRILSQGGIDDQAGARVPASSRSAAIASSVSRRFDPFSGR
jgi:DNA invertase Pin-like site-specific DNA recombinase